MKIFHLHSCISPVVLRTVLISGFILSSSTMWGSGLSGDTIQGNLILPWAPSAGNYFTQNASGSPTSSVPISAVVGPGIELGYYPAQTSTFTWRLTADVSDNRITINEYLSDPNPGYWLGEHTSWTLIVSGLDWAGAPGIANATYVTHDAHIGIQSFDAHSIQFAIDELVVYPTGPYTISRTTVVELTPIPEPAFEPLLWGCAGVALWRSLKRTTRRRWSKLDSGV
jgi:hypothetical protein